MFDVAGQRGDFLPQIAMRMREKDVNHHIKMIALQQDVNVYLHKCESQQLNILEKLSEIAKLFQLLKPFTSVKFSMDATCAIPTFFGGVFDCKQIAVLVIVCGDAVPEAFHIATRLVK